MLICLLFSSSFFYSLDARAPRKYFVFSASTPAPPVMDPKYKIAYWLTDKKKSKLKIDQIEQLLNRDGYQLIRITKPDDFVTKGPFAVFFHKLTDITVNFNISKHQSGDHQMIHKSNYSNSNDEEAENWIQKYKVSVCAREIDSMTLFDSTKKIEIRK